jgi:hypothetical protein
MLILKLAFRNSLFNGVRPRAVVAKDILFLHLKGCDNGFIC